MAVTLKELWDSRAFAITAKDSDFTLSWVAYGSADETEVYAGTLLVAPVTVAGLIRKNVEQKPLGGGVWRVDVKYGVVDAETAAGVTPGTPGTPGTPSKGDDDPLGVAFSFEISAVTTHITQSLFTLNSFKAGGGAAPDFKKAIGVTKDKIEGCDVFSGAMEMSVTATRAHVKLPYVRKLKRMVGRTNEIPWFGFDRGECLYLGASGQYTGDGFTPKFSVTHKMALGEYREDFDIGNGITVSVKPPFDYLWCSYEDKDIGGGLVFPVPTAAYIERVYEEGDFHDLEIGG